MDGDMDGDQHPDPDGLTYRFTFGEPVVLAHPGDTLTITLGPDGAHRFVLRAPNGAPVSHGSLTHLNFHAVTVERIERGRLLPVRPQPEPVTHGNLTPNSVTYRDPPGVTTYVGDLPVFDVRVTHDHRHPHTKPDDVLTIDYWHRHDHTHPGGRPDAHGYRHLHDLDRDADAALHDPGPGHGHDERGDDTGPGYSGATG